MDLHQENPDESCRHERSVEARMSLDINTNKHEKEWRQSMTPIRPKHLSAAMANGQWHVRVLKMLSQYRP